LLPRALGSLHCTRIRHPRHWGGFTRYPDSFITEYTKNYNATEFQVGARGTPPKVQTVEGDTTTVRYFYESPEKQPSPLQLLRNYQNAVKQIGGAAVYERLHG
jgi:OmpA-OmpF porin, OOP family